MILPSIFRENLLDDFFDYPHQRRSFQPNVHEMMKTDIKDMGSVYEMTMSLPGVKKEDVKAELKDGYLTISATTSSQNDKQDSNGTYVRRERYAGACSRSFYVGKDVNQENIKAKFEDGVLKLQLPKSHEGTTESSNYIAIEG